MIGLLLALVLPNLAMAQIVKTGDICIEIDTFFTDLAGDNWVMNKPRPARGVRYDVIDAVATHSGYLDDVTGCLHDFPVTVLPTDNRIGIRVYTEAKVKGVEMHAWEGLHVGVKDYQTVVWGGVATGITNTFSITKVVTGLDQRWTNLAVGTMVFRLYDWNVDQGNDRDCCIEGSLSNPDEYDINGLCGTQAPSGKQYARIATPIQIQVNPAGDCCGSNLINEDLTNGQPGVHTNLMQARKFPIAHEFGHVIAGMRMGGKEYGEYVNDVALQGCVGDWYKDGMIFGDNDRGEFTKEPMSTVLRESWGNFVSAMTWNTRWQDDCEYQVNHIWHDYDLNHKPLPPPPNLSLDDNRTGTDMDGAYDCEGIPSLPGDPSLESYVTSENWLEDLIDADDDNDDGVQCVAHNNATAESYHRSTIYDGLRFLWDVTTDQDVHPNDMSDVYVDMCPRGWYEGYLPTSVTDELPIERLLDSANHHGLLSDYDDEINHLIH